MKVLVVVDVQNDFVKGPVSAFEAEKVLPFIRKKVMKCRDDAEWKVLFSRDTHFDLAGYLKSNEGKHLPKRHCVFQTYGWFLSSYVDSQAGDIIDKYNFGTLDWQYYINEGDEIEIIGFCTDICVIYNALILKTLFPESTIRLDAKCCAGTSPELHDAAIKVMRSCQVDIINYKPFEEAALSENITEEKKKGEF